MISSGMAIARYNNLNIHVDDIEEESKTIYVLKKNLLEIVGYRARCEFWLKFRFLVKFK